MAATKLRDNIYFVGAINPALRVFDIIMEAEYGTTYNSYLITGDKNILIEAVHERFYDELLDNIQSVIGGAALDYLILNHNEPDHSGAIQALLKQYPDITVITSMGGKRFLENIANMPMKHQVVKQGDTLDTGIGKLEFIMAPMLHWPDTMFTYFPAQKTIFTCDFLGAHYCEPRILDSYIHYHEKYESAFAYYYAGIMGPFKPSVLQGLDKIEGLELEMVCVSHGPVLVEGIQKRMALYREWSAPQPENQKPKVLILYASAYGYTTQLAEAAYEAIMDDVDAQLLDAVFTPLSECAARANEADALLVGSCTINRDAVKPIWDVLHSIDAVNSVGKPAGAFGSYGWTGEAVPMMKTRLTGLKYKFMEDGIRCLFRPTEDDVKAISEYAKAVVACLK